MRRPPGWFLGFLMFVALLAHAPLRHVTLTIIRLPFTLLKTALDTALLVPRLPALHREHERLREDLLQAQREIAQLRESLRSAKQAEVLANAWPMTAGLVASIIGRSIIPAQQTILINRGRRHGVTLDSIVMEVDGVAGKVVEVQASTALVMLLTDPDSRVAATVERSRETGLLVGTGLGQCQLMYLEAQADIQEGDRVVTAGLGGPFPRGLALGAVTRIIRNVEVGSATVWVQPAVRLGQLEDVLCLPSD